MLRLLKATLISLPVYMLFKNMQTIKQATSLEEQDIIELSPYSDYKLNFSKANLKIGFVKSSKPVARREFKNVTLDGVGNLKCQVEFIGSIKDILSDLKYGSSLINAHEESKEEQGANSFKDDTSSSA